MFAKSPITKTMYASLFLVSLTCGAAAQHAHGSGAGAMSQKPELSAPLHQGDAAEITHILMAQFDRPDARLAVAPVAVSGVWAVAGWAQQAAGGRALLRKGAKGWEIWLCSGASLKQVAGLAGSGVPHADAEKIVAALDHDEAVLGAARIALFDSFQGTIRIGADGQHGHHGNHNAGAGGGAAPAHGHGATHGKH